MKALFFALTCFSVLLPSLASAGRETGNGGDPCENRFKIIRDDIQTWITSGGPLGLTLPAGITQDQYSATMLKEISQARISCTDEKIMVDGAEKVCKNFLNQRQTPTIVCNSTRFLIGLDQDSQYLLAHHEFAGLAGFESSSGENSIYTISNQIVTYLRTEAVRRLAIKKPEAQPSTDLHSSFGDFIGKYEIVGCATPSSRWADICKSGKTAVFDFEQGGGPGLMLKLSVPEAVDNEYDLPLKLEMAFEKSNPGDRCSTSSGVQYCEGFGYDGENWFPYSTVISLERTGNLISVHWNYSSSTKWQGFKFQTFSLLLKKT